jgi:hypothetical protein
MEMQTISSCEDEGGRVLALDKVFEGLSACTRVLDLNDENDGADKILAAATGSREWSASSSFSGDKDGLEIPPVVVVEGVMFRIFLLLILEFVS